MYPDLLRALSVSANPKIAYALLKDACSAWAEDHASSLGAALAFYTVFSLGPVLILAIAVAGLAFGQKAAESEFSRQLQTLLGAAGARAVQAIIRSANQPALGVIASTIGIGTLLAGASGAFVELQDALNKIWKVQPRSESILLGVIRERVFSFALVLVLGFLLLVSLVVSTALGAAGNFLLLAVIFKYLPDTEIAWADVWIGAAVTSLLLTTGKALVGLYLARSTVTSAYGVAAALIIILTWVYYSAQIFLLGAEATHVYCYKYGSRAEGCPVPR
jgi:membrane protein